MSIANRPKFMDTPFFVDEPGNWHLKEDAPENLKKDLEEFKKMGGLNFAEMKSRLDEYKKKLKK